MRGEGERGGTAVSVETFNLGLGGSECYCCRLDNDFYLGLASQSINSQTLVS